MSKEVTVTQLTCSDTMSKFEIVWNIKKKIKIKKKKKKNMRKKEHVFNVTQSRRPKSTPPKVKWLYLAFT